jgi:hypothetical protein
MKCETHKNVHAPQCAICTDQQMEKMRAALGQASLFIRWYGPKGVDKELTMKLINEALGSPYGDNCNG